MRKLSIVALLALLFGGCKKDEDKPSGPAGAGSLSRVVYSSGSDSTVIKIGYDANNRISDYSFESVTGGSFDTFRLKLFRDAAGRIIQMTEKQQNFPAANYDIRYNGISTQIKNIITSFNGNIQDSSFFVYNGNTIMKHIYYFPPGSSNYNAMGQEGYTFQNGNLVSMKYHDPMTGLEEAAITFTYDSKKAAHPRSIEETLITHIYDLGSTNNVTREVSVWPTSPMFDYSVTYNYNYLSSELPSGGQVITDSGTVALKYIYK